MDALANKLCSIKDVPLNSILKEGMKIILDILNADDCSDNVSMKKVRSITLFKQLANGTQFIRNLASGTIDQCGTQLQHLNLYQLIKIRLNQPTLFEVPESLMSHFRFMRAIDQAIFEEVVNYFMNKNRESYVSQFYKTVCDDKKQVCVSSKKRFGKDILIAFGLYSYLSSNNYLRETKNKNSKAASAKDPSAAESLKELSDDCSQYIWWRLIIEIPHSNAKNTEQTKENLKSFMSTIEQQQHHHHKPQATESFSPVHHGFSKTLPTCVSNTLLGEAHKLESFKFQHSGESIDRINRLAKGRRSIQHARSLSVEAAKRTIEEAGTTLINVFLKLPTVLLTTARPLHENVYLCEESDWVNCQTMGSLSAVAESANLKCNILELLPGKDLAPFLRPSDASYAIRTELASKIKSRTSSVCNQHMVYKKPGVMPKDYLAAVSGASSKFNVSVSSKIESYISRLNKNCDNQKPPSDTKIRYTPFKNVKPSNIKNDETNLFSSSQIPQSENVAPICSPKSRINSSVSIVSDHLEKLKKETPLFLNNRNSNLELLRPSSKEFRITTEPKQLQDVSLACKSETSKLSKNLTPNNQLEKTAISNTVQYQPSFSKNSHTSKNAILKLEAQILENSKISKIATNEKPNPSFKPKVYPTRVTTESQNVSNPKIESSLKLKPRATSLKPNFLNEKSSHDSRQNNKFLKENSNKLLPEVGSANADSEKMFLNRMNSSLLNKSASMFQMSLTPIGRIVLASSCLPYETAQDQTKPTKKVNELSSVQQKLEFYNRISTSRTRTPKSSNVRSCKTYSVT